MTGSFSPWELSSLFTEIAEQLIQHDDGESTFRALTRIAVERVPGASHAGITVGRAEQRFETVAATDETVRRTDQIQYALRSGPCVDAIIANTTFVTGDLRTDRRWPEFGERAYAATAILSMLSLRLFLESDLKIIASLNIYAEKPEAFDEASETMAVLVATHGSLAVGRAAARTKADNLSQALKHSREIGVAMGIIMATTMVTRDQAFDLLRIVSQRTHRKLSDIASVVADTGELPDLPHIRQTL